MINRLNISRAVVALQVAFLTVACHHPRLRAPVNYADVSGLRHDNRYIERNITADGVVVAVRQYDSPANATATFWEQAVAARISEAGNYALTGTEDIRARSGHAGRLLRFTRQMGEQHYAYWIAVFVDGPNFWGNRTVFVIEAGGPTEAFARDEAAIRRAFASFDAS